MSDTVLLAIQDQIATITLNRPKVFNAMNQDMGAALREVAQRVLEDDGVRAVLLRGAGAAFMAGGGVGACSMPTVASCLPSFCAWCGNSIMPSSPCGA